MSEFDEMFAEDVDAFNETFGETFTVIDAEGEETELTGPAFELAQEEREDGGMRVLIRRAMVHIPITEVAEVLAGFKVSWDDEEWDFDELMSSGAGFHRCRFVRIERINNTRAGRDGRTR